MQQFGKYSDYYDLIYSDKDYKKEIDFVLKLVKKFSLIKVRNVLSLGCGTANHDILLAKRGYSVLGIDKSDKMLKIGRKKIKEIGANNLRLVRSDIKSFKSRRKYDLAMAMFNVIGYQVKNEDMAKTLFAIAKSLRRNALFVFDCWYLPAVLKSRPTNRFKRIKDGNRVIIRKTIQDLDLKKNIIDIRFEVKDIINNKTAKCVKENHPMRFWSLPELKYFLMIAGFDFVGACNFLDLNSKISEDNWNIFIIARKK